MAQLRDVQTVDNGARFHNVDLHIHSYGGSHDVKDPTMTPEAIVDSAILQGLSIIAITDHNSDTNVKRALSHAAANYRDRILVLPGVEITTAHGHLLAYFAPDRISNLSKFLSKIDLVGEPGADNTRTTKSMADTIKEADQLGGICIAAHIDREKTGFEAFAVGLQNWKKDIIVSPGLYGLEADSTDALLWYSEHDAGPIGAERKKLFAARELIPNLAPRHHLAHVQGSDAHSMARFHSQEQDKSWTRIKLAELSFNAFKIALIDSTARVRASASVPRSIPRIRGLSIVGGFLHSEQMQFNNNLNCFIGGRGTGKSTAVRAIAYAFGLADKFAEYENCPDSVTVFCEDENGVVYRYARTRLGDIEFKAREQGTISDVPLDAFRIEYFGQGELANIAEDPLKHPMRLQMFLDRHISLRDLLESEESLVSGLKENAGRLSPLENTFSQLTPKKKLLADTETKLKLAEEGNLKEVVATQSKLASERALREAIETTASRLKSGFTFSALHLDVEQMISNAGTCTEDAASIILINTIKEELLAHNTILKQKEVELNQLLSTKGSNLERLALELKSCHQRIGEDVAQKIADLRVRGLATDLTGLDDLLRQKTAATRSIAEIEQRTDERKQCLDQRKIQLSKLKAVRGDMTARRKAQLKKINSSLALTIKEYTTFLRYDEAGITGEYENFLREKLRGSYIPDATIQTICNCIQPDQLASLVLSRNHGEIAELATISVDAAQKIGEKLCYWNILYELEILSKPPKPIITVRTKSNPPKDIPVLQLSDGQRHTILLTIAMLAETNVPLVIDQPEDDLDNAFIFSSIVTTLRAIKEKRQVIVVTHNANIAVLGDAELILPMHRENDAGKVRDRGSIDTDATRQRVLDILEGGHQAFQRRKAMYNY